MLRKTTKMNDFYTDQSNLHLVSISLVMHDVIKLEAILKTTASWLASQHAEIRRILSIDRE